MNRILDVIVLLLMLGALIPGCCGVHRYDSQLTMADSLIGCNLPDSALAILETLSADSLSTEGDRAYLDLLLTQARYKAYIPFTSDSIINRALTYYRAHPSEREKLTRAYIYKGAVMQDLKYPDSAMLYYKQAEVTADTTDYQIMGYINMRIAVLYQYTFFNDSAVVARMKNASRFYQAINDSLSLITTIGTLGLYDKIVGTDSAIFYLEKAIAIGKAVQSAKRFFYQSKLAGEYFYEQDYSRAKALSFDVILNGKDDCNENQFYYYAARSYIKLNQIDSALWVKSLIPPPEVTVDSMNMHLLLADLSQAMHKYRDYAYHAHSAYMIDNRITSNSAESPLSNKELTFDANQREKEMRHQSFLKISFIIGASLLIILGIILITVLIIKRGIKYYRGRLSIVQHEMEALMLETEERISSLQSERDTHCQQLLLQNREMGELVAERETHRQLLAHQRNELEKLRQKNNELESKQQTIADQVSIVVRHRNLALRELYDGIRVKSEEKRTKTVIPLVGMIKELINNHRVFHTPPKDTFWTNLRISVDGEYNGITSFVEEKYPYLSDKDLHLFLLMCGGFPNPIIRICMEYSHDATVSNNKRRLVKEKMKLGVTFDEFLSQYLQGRGLEDEPT